MLAAGQGASSSYPPTGPGLAAPYGAARDAGDTLPVVADTHGALLRIDLPESVEVTEAAPQSGTNP